MVSLISSEISSILQQNIDITIGRIAIRDTVAVAEFAHEFFARWCFTLRLLEPSNERTEAFTGLVSVIQLNGQVLLLVNDDDIFDSNAFAFTMACLSWDSEERWTKPVVDLVSILKYLRNNEKLWSSISNVMSSSDINKLNILCG